MFADVVKLVDTPDLGSGAERRGVQVPPSAPSLYGLDLRQYPIAVKSKKLNDRG